jgi:hypothetical protein
MALHEEQFNKNLNSLSYTLNVVLGDLDNRQQLTYLWNDNISSLILESDIDYPIIYGRMVYSDRDNIFFNQIDSNNTTLLRISIQENTLADDPTNSIRGKGDEFKQVFMIDRVEIINRSLQDTVYSIDFTSIDWAKYNNYLPYSSNGNKLHLTILKELFNRGGLNLKVSPGAQSIDKSSTFITPVNYSLSDSIKYILSISADQDTFVYNFTYDFIKNEYRLFSVKKDLDIILKADAEAVRLLPIDNVLILNSKENTGTGNVSQRSIYGIEEDNINGSTFNIENTKDLVFYKFDQTRRLWSTEVIDNNKIIDSLPKETSRNNERFINTFKSIEDITNLKFEREIVPREPFAYDRSIRDIFTDSKIIKFKTNSWLNRKSGDFIFVSIDKNDPMYTKFNGLWFVLKVIKNISGDYFEDVIYACRTERTKIDANFRELISKNEKNNF